MRRRRRRKGRWRRRCRRRRGKCKNNQITLDVERRKTRTFLKNAFFTSFFIFTAIQGFRGKYEKFEKIII